MVATTAEIVKRATTDLFSALRKLVRAKSGSNIVPLGILALGALLAFLPMLKNGYPPGVDAPTFLHLAWVTKQAVTGQLDTPGVDPYWYGGFPYARAYPPLSYGSVGVLSAITHIPIEVSYRLILYASYLAMGVAVYWLALAFGVRRVLALIAGLLALSAYPVFVGLGAWGWFTTFFALPFVLFSYGLLETAIRNGSWRRAVAAGALFGLAFVAHHTTAVAFTVAFMPYLVVQLVRHWSNRRAVITQAALFGVTAGLLAALWLLPGLTYLYSVGFSREIAGNWSFPSWTYREFSLQRGVIGLPIYPAYLGWIQLTFAALGVWIALLYGGAPLAPAVVLVTLTWFSLGERANPLIGYYPFSSLDVARFSLYMVPFMALMGGIALERLVGRLENLFAKHKVVPRVQKIAVGLVLGLLFIIPAIDVKDSGRLLQPVVPGNDVKAALGWASTLPADSGPLLGVGFINWDTYWFPKLADAELAHGWYDEGGRNWRLVREIRQMGWFDRVDPARLSELMKLLGVRYLLVYNWDQRDNPKAFLAALENSPDLFTVRESWGNLIVFERLP